MQKVGSSKYVPGNTSCPTRVTGRGPQSREIKKIVLAFSAEEGEEPFNRLIWKWLGLYVIRDYRFQH